MIAVVDVLGPSSEGKINILEVSFVDTSGFYITRCDLHVGW